MIIRIYTLWLFLIGVSDVFTQNPNLGIPFIQTYSKNAYQSGTQNWDIIQDDQGLMYFANNNGLMYFDGTVWKTHPLPNSTIVRSVAIADDGTIYVGGQNEFGKFVPDNHGFLSYQSLKTVVPEAYREFEDVWDIVTLDQVVFFRTSSKIYRIENSKCTIFEDRSSLFLDSVNGRVVAHDLKDGLVYFDGKNIEAIAGAVPLKDQTISKVLYDAGSLIIATKNDGLFQLKDGILERWVTDADDFLKQNHITSASKTTNGQIALGTDFAGVLIIDKRGKSQFHLDRGNSLLNNKIFCTYYDKNQNLWLGVDSGINFIELNSPFTRIYPDGELKGAGFAAKVFENKIYLGTNNGLYVADWKNHYEPLNTNGFELVENTKGQNWGLDIVDGALLLGHNKGAFEVKGKRAKQIDARTGYWNFDILQKNPSFALAGTYNNLTLLERKEGRWTYSNDFKDWYESSRFLEQDEEGNIWMSHPYKGVFKIQIEDNWQELNVKKYDAGSGLPSAIKNHLFKIKNKIVFCGESGIYAYNPQTDRFEPDERFNKIFGAKHKVRRLFEAPNNDIWFVTENIGVLKVEDLGLDKKISKQVFSRFKKQLNPGFESIYPYDEKNVFITHDKGFVHYNPSFENTTDYQFNVLFSEVRLTASMDSIVFGGYENGQRENRNFTARENALQFSFSATDFAGYKHLHYRYFLDGFDNDWLDWAEGNTKEYTNLPPGNYTFKVQAKNQNEVTSNIAEYTFRIRYPWYQTPYACGFYVLVLLSLIGGVIRKFQKKYYGLKQDRDQTIKASEEVIDRLKEEKIKVELEYKQRELASTAMHVVQKNETLSKVKAQLQELKKMNENQTLSKEIQKMINMLQQDEIIDDGWEQFMLHFNQLHGDFYTRLKANYPDLTPKDLKLCTYLRMNLSTKEMASLLNVTTRGIEASRYRLRKKIQLNKEENLTEFLMSF